MDFLLSVLKCVVFVLFGAVFVMFVTTHCINVGFSPSFATMLASCYWLGIGGQLAFWLAD